MKRLFLLFLLKTVIECLITNKISITNLPSNISLSLNNTKFLTNKTSNHNKKIKKENNINQITKATTTIFLSGLFDKSFFITAFMAMKYSKWVVLTSTTLSLSLIGILSVYLGITINKYIPVIAIDLIAISLFLIFGILMIYDGVQMKEDETQVVLSEDQEKLCPINENKNIDENYVIKNNNVPVEENKQDFFLEYFFKNKTINAFFKIFFMIFFSEIGDRSQISTIYLTINFDKICVIVAVVISSFTLTIFAVYAGKIISNKISEKKLTIFAGWVFVVFGLVAIFLLVQNKVFLKK